MTENHCEDCGRLTKHDGCPICSENGTDAVRCRACLTVCPDCKARVCDAHMEWEQDGESVRAVRCDGCTETRPQLAMVA